MADRAPYRRRRLTAVGILLVLTGAAVVALRHDALPLPAAGDGGQRIEQLDIRSAALRRTIRVDVILPPGDPAGRALLLDLHGKGRAEPSGDGFVGRAALAALGERAPVAVLAADDGDSYWHDRATGKWATYLRDDLVPQVQRHYRLGPKLALSGLSMGGSGVLQYALRHPGEVCAAVASSPALWTAPGLSAPGAYDSAEDFARNDPFVLLGAGPDAMRAPYLWIDIGTSDPFLSAARRFAQQAGTRARYTERAGGHNGDFWRSGYRRYLPWLAARLRTCSA